MINKKTHDERLESLMNPLAESVLGISDETILEETSEVGADPGQEAERARSVLRQASSVLNNVTERLSNLRHTINSDGWHRGHWGYHNTCQTCGSFASFATATGEMRGDALDELCAENDEYTSRRRQVSRK
jgi:hypothetical protein